MVATFFVEDDADRWAVNDYINCAFPHATHDIVDATTWEWDDFWRDVNDGVIGPAGDTSTRHGWMSMAASSNVAIQGLQKIVKETE